MLGLFALFTEDVVNLALGNPLPLSKLLWISPWYLLPPAAAAAVHRSAPWGVLGFVVAGRLSFVGIPLGLPGWLPFVLVPPLLWGLAHWRKDLEPNAVWIALTAFLVVSRPLPFVVSACLALALALGFAGYELIQRKFPQKPTWAASLAYLMLPLWAAMRALVQDPLPTPAHASSRPDLVLVLVDTLRADHLGTYGYGRSTSPTLDAWASHGLRFDQAQSSASWTLPSVASIFTGLEPYQHGAGVSTGEGNTESPLTNDHTTVAEVLSKAGYRTMALTTNGYLRRPFGLHQGFDHYDDALGSRAVLIAEPFDALGVPFLRWRAYRPADEMVDKAISWWSASEGGPRFLVLHLMDPHKPLIPPAEHRAQFSGESALVDDYDAEVHFVDAELARLFDTVAGATVIFTADHGEDLGDRPGAYPEDRWPEGTRHGHTQYQELLRVPLIVVGPGIPSGVVERPVQSRDISGALLTLAGIPSQRTLTELTGVPGPANEPARSQFTRVGTEKTAVRIGKWKLIRTKWGDELYDLDADPKERQPIPGPNSLSSELPPATTAEPSALDNDLRQQLERLGYVH